MTETNRYQRQAQILRDMATLLEELNRFLGNPDLTVITNGWGSQPAVDLWDHSGTEINGSPWHKTVVRLSDLFGPPLITDTAGDLLATFATPFEIHVRVRRNRKPKTSLATQLTLSEAVA